MHANLLIWWHVDALSMWALMHGLWRVKGISMNLLVVIVHLIWHGHMLIHVHIRLVLHGGIRMNVAHLLV